MNAQDENELAQAGKLSPNPKDGAIPIPIVDGKRVHAPQVLTVRDLLTTSMERAFSREPRTFCTTGVNDLDDATGGMRAGHVWVFGADTSWGKSSFLVMVADENMSKGKRVLIVSAEDAPSMYGDRLMVRRAQVDAKRYRDRRLEPKEMDAVAKVAAAARPDPVYLDARGKKAELVAAEVKLAIAKYRIDLVAYDYLQEFRSSSRQQDRRNEVSEVAAILRESIKTSGVTGIIFSQITVSEGKKHPDKHSIRESRDVSNAAEAVLLGFTPEKAFPRRGGGTIEAGTKCVLIDKAKDGVRCTVPLEWDEKTASFRTVSGPYDDFDSIAEPVSYPDNSEERYP